MSVDMAALRDRVMFVSALTLLGCGSGSGDGPTDDAGGAHPGDDIGGDDVGHDEGGPRDTATSDTSATPDTGPSDTMTPPDTHVASSCDKLGAKGTWDDVTPPGVDESTFGVAHVLVDPNKTSTIYLGTSLSGLFKSLDCGAHWVHIDTGTLGADIDKGSVGPLIDPVDSNILYTGSLYGTNGLFKSINGGVDWTQILNGEVRAGAPYGGFVGHIDMDPSDHLHLLVAWHAECAAPHTKSCYGETKDGGATWKMRDGRTEWIGGEGAALQFLTSTTWLFSSSSNGMWRSVDSGGTWTSIPDATIAHGSGQLFRTSKGAYFLGSANGMLYSPDGAKWSLVPGSGRLIQGVAGDDTHVWSSEAYPYNPPDRPAPFFPYHQAVQAAPLAWTTLDSPKMSSGGATLAYDADHHLLYSANYWEGLRRVVAE